MKFRDSYDKAYFANVLTVEHVDTVRLWIGMAGRDPHGLCNRVEYKIADVRKLIKHLQKIVDKAEKIKKEIND